MATVKGTNNSDLLDAADGVTDGADTINGLGGNDIIFGLGGSDVIDGGDGNDVIDGGADGDLIRGGAGNDTASYSDAQAGVFATLITGVGFSGDALGDRYESVENLTGSSFNDRLEGDHSVNVLDGGSGNDYFLGFLGGDTIIGGAGVDTVAYFDAFDGGVNVSLLTGLGHGATAEGDRLSGIENLFGSQFNDVLEGDEGANTLNGWMGDDLLVGGFGADILVGGSGIDTASYTASQQGVFVNLASRLGSGGDAQGDFLMEIENLTGSSSNDVLIGDSSANVLDGGDGDDSLSGGAGVDLLLGGAGSDSFDGGAGADAIIGGSDRDFVDYRNSAAAVNVSLATGTGHGGDAEGDVLMGIEDIRGSAFNDVLEGSDVMNFMYGSWGTDTMTGKGGADFFV